MVWFAQDLRLGRVVGFRAGLLLALFNGALVVSPAMAADPVRGQALYAARCGSCHALDANRIGPRHAGVMGRKAGSLADFRYSPALSTAGFVWTEAQMDRWLQGPGKLVPGVRMFATVREAADRADIIAFLATTRASK